VSGADAVLNCLQALPESPRRALGGSLPPTGRLLRLLAASFRLTCEPVTSRRARLTLLRPLVVPSSTSATGTCPRAVTVLAEIRRFGRGAVTGRLRRLSAAPPRPSGGGSTIGVCRPVRARKPRTEETCGKPIRERAHHRRQQRMGRGLPPGRPARHARVRLRREAEPSSHFATRSPVAKGRLRRWSRTSAGQGTIGRIQEIDRGCGGWTSPR
jgi:hypothetical protein